MKILFTCGGTAGHINPAVALARLFQERSGAEVLFVGAKGGMEERLVPKEGFALETVTISSFWRSVSPASIKHNLTTVRNLSVSRKEANRILDDFQPDLVVGTGGYASYPVVHEAAKRGIPTAVHDSNAVPGLTTKRLAKVADRVMVGYEASRAHYQHPERVVVTGTPVRGDFFKLDRQQARAALGITDDRPLVLSYWGSLGAEGMNQHMTDYLRLAAADGAPFHHIHGAGRDFATMTKALEGENLPKDLEIREYIYDMPTVMQAADLVLCRGGASTLSELTAIGKPAVIVPRPMSPTTTRKKTPTCWPRRAARWSCWSRCAAGRCFTRRRKSCWPMPPAGSAWPRPWPTWASQTQPRKFTRPWRSWPRENDPASPRGPLPLPPAAPAPPHTSHRPA